MKKNALLLVLLLSAVVAYWVISGPRPIPGEKTEAIRNFLKKTIADSLEKDYQRHGIPASAAVTDLAITRITKRETRQDTVYFAVGKVSYRIRGPETWRDPEGNLVKLGQEQTITHWFSCGILEDRYLGTFREDDRNRFQFYADKPAQ